MKKEELSFMIPTKAPEISVRRVAELTAPDIPLVLQKGNRIYTLSISEMHSWLWGLGKKKLFDMKAAMIMPVFSPGSSNENPVEINLCVRAVPMPEHPDDSSEPQELSLMSLHMLCNCPIRVVAWGSGRELIPDWDAQGSRPGVESLEILGGITAIPGIEKIGCRRPRLIPMLEAAVDERKFLLAVEEEAKVEKRKNDMKSLEREAMESLETEAGGRMEEERRKWEKKGIRNTPSA